VGAACDEAGGEMAEAGCKGGLGINYRAMGYGYMSMGFIEGVIGSGYAVL
jgi:hypothetical protein